MNIDSFHLLYIRLMDYCTRLRTCGFALALLLLGACAKQKEEPTPDLIVVGAYQPVDSQQLQQKFQTERYDDMLREVLQTKPLDGISWKYVPNWKSVLRKNANSAVAYFYVPLEPVIAKPHSVVLVGNRKFLRFKQNNGQWQCSLVEYSTIEPKGNVAGRKPVANGGEFLTTFTGNLIVTRLEDKQVNLFAYTNGVRQQFSSAQSKGLSTTSCEHYSCTWVLSCPYMGFGGREFMVLHTSGDGDCEDPYGYTLACGYETVYQLTNQQVTRSCFDTGGDPGDDGNNGGWSGGTSFDPNNPLSYDETNDAMVNLDEPALGNYGAVIVSKYDATSNLELKIEIDSNNKEVKKLFLHMTGLVGPTTCTQTGDGTFLRYDASNNRYYFSVTFVVSGTGNTMYNGRNQFLSGWIDLDNNTARTRLYMP